jgi:hypothetical protein
MRYLSEEIDLQSGLSEMKTEPGLISGK